MILRGKTDQRVAQAIRTRLGEGPADILDLLESLRADLGDLLARREGHVHALLLRQVREQRIVAGGVGARGLVRYGLAASAPPPAEPLLAPPTPPGPRALNTAAQVTRKLRAVEARQRVAGDVAAHLDALDAAGQAAAFGSPRAVHVLLDRVGRGRASVILVRSLGDGVRRLLVHEGPWLVGVVGAYLLLQMFLVKVYQIPSPSMEPTLQIGDRVVVFLPGRQEVPARWSIVTYERGELTYVKRVVGLPGEELALHMGDVYANGTLLVKPVELAEELRALAYEWDVALEPGSDPAVSRRFEPPESHLQPDGARGAPYAFALQDGFAQARVTRSGPGGGRIELSLLRPGTGEQPSARFSLVVDEQGVRLMDQRGQGRSVELARAEGSPPDGTFTIELAYVDGHVWASTPGWSHREQRLAPYGGLRPSVEAQGPASVTWMGLFRDLHYSYDGGIGAPSGDGLPLNPHRIAPGHVFFLGDNTNNSRDSRWAEVSDIPIGNIIGPVRWRVWPPKRIGSVR